MSHSSAQHLPTVLIGAGPVGLAAAAHLLERGLEPLVLEAGPRAADAVRSWGHVRLFSGWAELVDPAAARLLEPTGWVAPPAGSYPTGAEWVERYLQPLADALGDRVVYSTLVTGLARRGRDRVVDSGRQEQPFTVHLRTADGIRTRLQAQAVVDASGTFGTPNPLGADGYPVDGERESAERISYRIPDLSTASGRQRYAGRRTAVVGSGHSAMTALLGLVALARTAADTSVVWVLRRGTVDSVFGGGAADELPARGALGLAVREAVAEGQVRVVPGFRTEALRRDGAKLVLLSDDGRRVDGVDEVVALTGLRPDHSVAAELRLTLDERLEAPRGLAPLIDPNVHSCGSVPAHGARELAQGEEGFVIVGMKSYGRAPTFLAMTGYEQVRSVAAALAGDHEAAARVELSLPETGVCGGSGLFDEGPAPSPDGGCCVPVPAVIQLGAGQPAHA